MNYEEKHEYVLINGKKHYVIHPKNIKSKIKPNKIKRTLKDKNTEFLKFKLGGGL